MASRHGADAARLLLIALFCLGALFPGRSQEKRPTPGSPLPAPPRILVPKLRATLSLDGNLTEPVWSKAAVISPFVKTDGSGPERDRTAVRLWYDDDALYVGWTIQDPDIQATLTARDSHFWDEEVAEFFVTPGALDRYFELQWNPLGGVFDSIINNRLDEQGRSRGFSGNSGFTAKGMRSAVVLKGTADNSNDRDEMWQVEIIIPFADLGTSTPQAKSVWRGNFYRFNRTKGQPPELLGWSPTYSPSFHQPSRFGYLEFGD